MNSCLLPSITHELGPEIRLVFRCVQLAAFATARFSENDKAFSTQLMAPGTKFIGTVPLT